MQKDRRKGVKEQKTSNTKMLWAMIAGLAVLVVIILILNKIDRTPATKEKEKSGDEKIDKIKNYEFLADEKLYYIKIEMAKEVSPYKFILRDIEKVENLSKSALKLDSTLTTSWERLGYVNSHIHGHQAFKRYQSYTNREMKDEAKQAEKEALTYFVLAEAYYKKALEYGPIDSANIYLLWGESYELQEGFDTPPLLPREFRSLPPRVALDISVFVVCVFFSIEI